VTLVRERRFDQATQAKLDRVRLRTENRARLSRVREALARISAELEAAVRNHRKSFTSAELIEERWLLEIKRARFDLDKVSGDLR
jgi:hypothetical protein